jgi:hypothetical protein
MLPKKRPTWKTRPIRPKIFAPERQRSYRMFHVEQLSAGHRAENRELDAAPYTLSPIPCLVFHVEHRAPFAFVVTERIRNRVTLR